jgi:hypothetical protein
MRRTAVVVVLGTVLAALGVAPAAAAPDARTFVFQGRFAGYMAGATWTTCPAPSPGDICTDTIVLAFDASTSEKAGPGPMIRSRGPVLRTLTFVYRVLDGSDTTFVAEWFGRSEDAAVSVAPRLNTGTAAGTVPISVCSVSDEFVEEITCPESLSVQIAWTATGPRARVADHVVNHGGVRTENLWTRGWERTATASGQVGTRPLGTLLDASLARIDQGETVIQHPVG